MTEAVWLVATIPTAIAVDLVRLTLTEDGKTLWRSEPHHLIVLAVVFRCFVLVGLVTLPSCYLDREAIEWFSGKFLWLVLALATVLWYFHLLFPFFLWLVYRLMGSAAYHKRNVGGTALGVFLIVLFSVAIGAQLFAVIVIVINLISSVVRWQVALSPSDAIGLLVGVVWIIALRRLARKMGEALNEL